MKKMVTTFVIAATLCFCAFPLSAQAVIQEVSGKVEIRLPGSADWENARQGQTVPADTVISTGFDGMVKVNMGNTVLTVRSLTVISLEELSLVGDSEHIQLYLRSGRIRAEVPTPIGDIPQLTVRSPVGTASVRGTVFEFDTINLVVTEGTVEFSGALNVSVLVDAGSSSFADERTGRAALPPDVSAAALRPELPIASNFTDLTGQTAAFDNTKDLQAIIRF